MKSLFSIAFVLLINSPGICLIGAFNKPLRIDPISDFEPIAENSGTHTLILIGISDEDDDQIVTQIESSDNNELISNPIVEYDHRITTILKLTPRLDANGKAKITKTLNHGTASNNATEASFEHTVYAVNNKPTFQLSSDLISINENAGNYKFKKFATDLDDGDPELKQNLSFIISIKTTTGGLEFKTLPVIDVKRGDLKFEISPNSHGEAMISVLLQDDGGTADGGLDISDESVFTIKVVGVNDPPTIDPILDFGPIAENSATQKINLTGISDGDGGEDQIVTIIASSDNNDLISNPIVEYDQGTTAILKLTPELNANGKAIITITLNDGQASDNITETSFELLIYAVNGKPSFQLASNLIKINEDANTYEYQQFATDLYDGDPELNQNLSFSTSTKTISGHLEFKSLPVIDVTNGNLTFEISPNSHGEAIVSVVLQDDGGTADGGLDISDESVFTINDINVNNPPTLDDIQSPVTLYEDAGDQILELAGISSGEYENQELQFSVVSSVPELISLIEIDYTNGETIAILTFSPNPHQFGDAVISVILDDGQPDNNTVSKQFSVAISPVADTPTISDAISKDKKQTTSGLVISRNSVDSSEVTYFKITSIQNGTLFLNDGVSEIFNNDFISYEEGNKGLKFSPSIGISTSGSFEVQAAIGQNDLDLGGSIVIASIFIDNVPPDIVSIPDSVAGIDQLYNYDVIASDLDEFDSLIYTITIPQAIESWLKAVDNYDKTALIFGTPPLGSAGVYNIYIKVEDRFGDYDEQLYTLLVDESNIKPLITSFSKNIQEDETIIFLKDDFNSGFSDADGDTLYSIKIVSVPNYGTLKLGEVELEKDVEIGVGKINQLKYIPNMDYFGFDVFDWNASDGENYSTAPQSANILITSINDPPEIINFESELFTYEYGAQSMAITESAIVVDIDNDQLEKVKVTFTENYIQGEDSIIFNVVDGLYHEWKDSLGVLLIQGVARTSVYQDVLRSLKYVNFNSFAPTDHNRVIEVVLHDIDTFSIPHYRQIEFKNTFVNPVIPTGFTPNHDGVNDTWDIDNLNLYDDYQITVYSRSGARIFESTDYLKEWDGVYNGSLVPVGTYYYIISIHEFNKIFKGTISVLR